MFDGPVHEYEFRSGSCIGTNYAYFDMVNKSKSYSPYVRLPWNKGPVLGDEAMTMYGRQIMETMESSYNRGVLVGEEKVRKAIRTALRVAAV